MIFQLIGSVALNLFFLNILTNIVLFNQIMPDRDHLHHNQREHLIISLLDKNNKV